MRLAADTTLYDIYAHPNITIKTPDVIAAILAPLLKLSKSELYNKLKNTDSIYNYSFKKR